MRASIPSPSRSELHLGPFPLRGYALCIILGVIAAVFIGERRLRARGYPAGKVADIAVWAVPFGLVGGRLYHVIRPAVISTNTFFPSFLFFNHPNRSVF